MIINPLLKKSLMQNAPRLFFDIGENDFRIRLAGFFDKFNNNIGAGGIDYRNISEVR